MKRKVGALAAIAAMGLIAACSGGASDTDKPYVGLGDRSFIERACDAPLTGSTAIRVEALDGDGGKIAIEDVTGVNTGDFAFTSDTIRVPTRELQPEMKFEVTLEGVDEPVERRVRVADWCTGERNVTLDDGSVTGRAGDVFIAAEMDAPDMLTGWALAYDLDPVREGRLVNAEGKDVTAGGMDDVVTFELAPGVAAEDVSIEVKPNIDGFLTRGKAAVTVHFTE